MTWAGIPLCLWLTCTLWTPDNLWSFHKTISSESTLFFQFQFWSSFVVCCNPTVTFLLTISTIALFSQISTLRRQGRTLYPTVPENAEREAQSLFVQEVGWFLRYFLKDFHSQRACRKTQWNNWIQILEIIGGNNPKKLNHWQHLIVE